MIFLAPLFALGLTLASENPAVPSPGGETTGSATAPGAGAITVFDTLTVVAHPLGQAVGRVAGTVTVIDRATLDRRLTQDLRDAVRHEPGLAVTADAGRFGLGGFRLRGVEGNRVAIELDGLPLPDGFSIGSFSNAGRLAVEPELLSSVEVLHGPASALHGSDALGGVVALTTRDPAELLAESKPWAFGLRAAWDGRDDGRRGSALAAAQIGGWQALFVGARREARERDNEGAVRANPARRDFTTGFAKWTRAAGRGRIEWILDRQQDRARTDVRHLIDGPGQFATTEQLLADDRTDRSRLAFAHFLSPQSDRWIEGRWRVHWLAVDTRQETTQLRRADRAAPSPTRRDRRFDLAQERAGLDFAARSRGATGPLRHDLSWGGAFDRSAIEERRDGREINLSTGAATQVVIGERLPVRDFPNSTAQRLGLYLVDEITLGRGAGRWRLLPAVRYDRYATRARPDRLFREDNPNLAVVDIDQGAWTPRVGAIGDLGRGHSVYLQFAEGFRAPPVHDVNIGFTVPAFNFTAIPNPDLRPERSHGFEVGWRHAGPAASFQLTAFDNRYRDLIESRANLGRDAVTGAILFQSVNRDRARIWGVEARARIDPRRAWPGLDGWSVETGLSWSRGEDLRRDEPLNTIDPAKLTLDLRYQPPGAEWAASVVSTFVASKRGKVDDSVAPLFAPPGYQTLDLTVQWRLGARTRWSAAVLNALDRRYWSFASVRGVLGNDPLLDFHTEPGRSVVAEVQITF